ncbi:MAG: oligosaccharide flippase family protein, partial [Anaerolineales bacterium]|nr:oligosaccharide flippase family protein [Anaerolineales bacterium]
MFRQPFAALNKIYLRIFDSEFMRRILRNSSYLVSATVVTAGIGFVQNAIQFRVLGVAGIGLLAAIVAFANVINRFTAFRIDELVIKYVRLYVERKEPLKAAAVYKLAALLEAGGSLLAFVLIYVLAPLGVQFFSDVSGVEALFVLYGTLVLI